MKRIKSVLAAVLTLAGVWKMETGEPDCKHSVCAIDQPAKLLEQPHASEEPPTFEARAVRYMNHTSPPTSMSREDAIEHMKQYGPDSITVYADDWKEIPFSAT